jgi:hypothetical protein
MDMATPESFVEELDPGLLTYKEELFMRSVTSFATLKFLRPREVCEMKVPEVYKRLLIDKIISLQSPDTKRMMKRERSPFMHQNTTSKIVTESSIKRPKQLEFGSHGGSQSESGCAALQPKSTENKRPRGHIAHLSHIG